MSSVLIVNEISTEREEITRALEAEGFTVVQAASAAEAVREIWGGSFLVAIIPTLLTGTTSTSLQQQLVQMAPEIETLIHQFLKNPVNISVKTGDTANTIEQDVVRVPSGKNKFDILCTLLSEPGFDNGHNHNHSSRRYAFGD